MSNKQVRWRWSVVNSASVLELTFPHVGLKMRLERRPFHNEWWVTRLKPHFVGFSSSSNRIAIKAVRAQYAIALAEKFAEVTHV